MSYRVDTTENFEREAKKLIKKYKSLKGEVDELVDSLHHKPFQGKHLGGSVYKIRLKVKSKGKGKRGGARVITKVKIVDEIVYLFSIYSKGDKNDISDDEIQDLLREVP